MLIQAPSQSLFPVSLALPRLQPTVLATRLATSLLPTLLPPLRWRGSLPTQYPFSSPPIEKEPILVALAMRPTEKLHRQALSDTCLSFARQYGGGCSLPGLPGKHIH